MNEERIAAKLEAVGVPPERAEQKAADSAIGWVLTLIGGGSFLAAAALSWAFITSGAEVGLWVVLLMTLFVGFAFVCVGVGLHLVAREAAPNALRSIADMIVGIIQAIRGNS